VIFMDLKMTDLDGLEATRRLRADPATARIPVIAVTASAHGDARVAAREAGCIDYLPKPVRAETLFAALQTHLGVTFVGRIADAAASHVEPDVPHAAPRPEIGRRLHAAAAIGDVTALEALAQQLVGEDRSSAALGQRISRLAANFDFDGLRDLASSLSIEETDVRAGN
jgi:response regulator RpfG family c-di-GMP phosphodiesterase